MNPIFAVAIFFVIWWTVLFTVLPFAGRSQAEDGSVVPGTPSSAPSRPQFLRVILWTTLISLGLLAGLLGLINAELVSFATPPGPA
jgi:predicted secreted protein